jgi:hypothetical protein
MLFAPFDANKTKERTLENEERYKESRQNYFEKGDLPIDKQLQLPTGRAPLLVAKEQATWVSVHTAATKQNCKVAFLRSRKIDDVNTFDKEDLELHTAWNNVSFL